MDVFTTNYFLKVAYCTESVKQSANRIYHSVTLLLVISEINNLVISEMNNKWLRKCSELFR